MNHRERLNIAIGIHCTHSFIETSVIQSVYCEASVTLGPEILQNRFGYRELSYFNRTSRRLALSFVSFFFFFFPEY